MAAIDKCRTLMDCAGFMDKEGEHDLPFLSIEKAHSPFLFLHPFLHHLANDNVCARSNAACLGCVLYSSTHVLYEYFTLTKILPFPSSLSSI